jgi:biofilm PGA synthesis N-glycosyltransferase PgaC
MISIVIPAYNEEKNIGNCLNSLVAQQTGKNFRIIVVDNNSTDDTVKEARSFSKNLHITVLYEKRKGRGAARKAGFEYSTDEIILSTDADTILPSNWVETLSNALTENIGVAVTGTCRIDDCTANTNKIVNVLQPLGMRIYRVIFGHYWLSGFNFAIFNEAYKKSGGFSADLNAIEDIDLSFKVSKIGKIIFLSNTPVLAAGRRFRFGFFAGANSYLVTFLKYLFLKKTAVWMTDPR